MKYFSVFLLAGFLMLQPGYEPTNLSSGKHSAEPQAEEAIYYKDKAIVLLYHHIVEQFEQGQAKPLWMEAAQFKAHVEQLIANGYEIISMDQYVDFALHQKPLPPNAVLLTFDDGYESFYTYAYPILKQLDATATVFIIGYSSDLYNPDAIPHLTWDQMRELKDNGMGIYSHTYNSHQFLPVNKQGIEKPALTNRIYLKYNERVESNAEYKKRIQSDLSFMEYRLKQELGPQPKLLAFPYGDYNETVLKVGKEIGIDLFFTTKRGINTANDREIYRINVGEPNIAAEDVIELLKSYHD